MGLPVSQENLERAKIRASVGELNTIQDREYKRRLNTSTDIITYGLPAVVAGFANTVSDTLGLTDGKDFENFINNTFPNLGAFYSRNKKGAQAIGDFAGMFAPGLGALKAYRVAGTAARAFTAGNKRAQLLNSVFTSGRKTDELVRSVQTADL